MPPQIPASIRIHPRDTVAVALRPPSAGECVEGAVLREPVAQGHKVALAHHAAGAVVTKYGQPIGRATRAIAAGEHVHTHNLATALAGELTYAARVGAQAAAAAPPPSATWRGYRRADGRAATRNEVWILPTVGCVGITAEQVAFGGAVAARGRDRRHPRLHPPSRLLPAWRRS
jgi:altronate hydrolase